MEEALSGLPPLVGVKVEEALDGCKFTVEVSLATICGVVAAFTAVSSAFNCSSKSLVCSRLLIRVLLSQKHSSGAWPTESQYQGSILLENLLSSGIEQVSQVH